MSVTPQTKVVMTVGTLATMVIVILTVLIAPAVSHRLKQLDDVVKSDATQQLLIDLSAEKDKEQDRLISASAVTDATQSADTLHNSKRLDTFAMVLKDIFEGQRIMQDGNTELKIGQAEIFQILKSWEPRKVGG